MNLYISIYIVKNLTQQLIYYSAAVLSGQTNKNDVIFSDENKEKLRQLKIKKKELKLCVWYSIPNF